MKHLTPEEVRGCQAVAIAVQAVSGTRPTQAQALETWNMLPPEVKNELLLACTILMTATILKHELREESKLN